MSLPRKLKQRIEAQAEIAERERVELWRLQAELLRLCPQMAQPHPGSVSAVPHKPSQRVRVAAEALCALGVDYQFVDEKGDIWSYADEIVDHEDHPDGTTYTVRFKGGLIEENVDASGVTAALLAVYEERMAEAAYVCTQQKQTQKQRADARTTRLQNRQGM